MTEQELGLGNNPSRLVEDGRRAKEANRQRLGEVLSGRGQELPEADALAARIATMIAPVIDAAIDAVVTGTTDDPPAPAPAPLGFDGGARQSVPLPPPRHDQWLVAVIRERLADRGAQF